MILNDKQWAKCQIHKYINNMRPLIIFIVFYFKVFFKHFILEFIIIYWQYIQTLLELFLKSLHKVPTFPYCCPIGARAYAGSACQEKWNGGKAFSQLPRGMPSLFSAYKFLNASTGRNMQPFETWKILSWSGEHYLSSDTDFQPQNGRKKGENILYKILNLLIALVLIAVANWGARILIKGGIDWEVEIRGDVLDCRSSKISPVAHPNKVRTSLNAKSRYNKDRGSRLGVVHYSITAPNLLRTHRLWFLSPFS